MRREKAPTRSRWFWILVAGLIGFLVGDRHASTWQSMGASPSQNVALRFPEPKDEATFAEANAPVSADTTATIGATSAPVLGGAQFALLNPEPMVAAPARRLAPQASARAPNPQIAVAPLPAKVTVVPRPRRAESKPAAQGEADTATRHADRPGLMLNDAQIASIKQRLHLTADQESMWPAVEAALRNVAYARARDAHRPGAPANAAQLASADPDSIEVRGLKSAAVPLIMSFSDEQKQEVRSLAHVMGLDKLASEL
jgi:hypothetical protein